MNRTPGPKASHSGFFWLVLGNKLGPNISSSVQASGVPAKIPNLNMNYEPGSDPNTSLSKRFQDYSMPVDPEFGQGGPWGRSLTSVGGEP